MARRVRETPAGQTNVVDSSAWIAYFENEPTASDFAAAVESVERLVVPTICRVDATARLFGATLWTQDAHFDGLPDVRFHPKRRA